MKKKGQIKLSFGMIFSIILIIVFIGFAIYGIKIFLGIGDKTKIALAINNIQEDVNSVYASSQASIVREYSLIDDVEQVCFTEDSVIYFEPLGSGQGVDMVEIKSLKVDEEFCFDVEKNKVKFVIKKDYGDKSVFIGD